MLRSANQGRVRDCQKLKLVVRLCKLRSIWGIKTTYQHLLLLEGIKRRSVGSPAEILLHWEVHLSERLRWCCWMANTYPGTHACSLVPSFFFLTFQVKNMQGSNILDREISPKAMLIACSATVMFVLFTYIKKDERFSISPSVPMIIAILRISLDEGSTQLYTNPSLFLVAFHIMPM